MKYSKIAFVDFAAQLWKLWIHLKNIRMSSVVLVHAGLTPITSADLIFVIQSTVLKLFCPTYSLWASVSCLATQLHLLCCVQSNQCGCVVIYGCSVLSLGFLYDRSQNSAK